MSAEGVNQAGGAGQGQQPAKPNPAKSSSGGVITVIGVLVVLLLAELGGAYYFGGKAETRLREMVAAQNKQLAFYGYGEESMTVTSYEKSFFSSQAVVKMNIRTPLAVGEALEFELPVAMQHGPVLFGTGGIGVGAVRMVFENDFVSMFNTMLPQVIQGEGSIQLTGDYKFTGIMTLGLTGQYSFSCLAPPSTVGVTAPEEGAAFQVKPGNVTCSGTISQDFMSQKGRMDIDTASAEIEGVGEAFTMKGVKVEYDLSLDPEDFLSGTYSLGFDELAVPMADLVLTGFKNAYTLPKSEGPTFSVQSATDIETLRFALPQDQSLEFAPVEQRDSINDISKAGVRKYFELVQKASAANGNPEAVFQSEEVQADMLAAMNEALGHGPDYDLTTFRVVAPERGQGAMTFSIGVPEGTSFDPENAEAILNSIEADLGLRIDRDFAVYITEVTLKAQQPGADPAEVAQMAGGMVDQSVASVPFFKVENGVIMTDVSVRNQMVSINGEAPVPIEELMAGFGMGPGAAQPDEGAAAPQPQQ